MTSPIRRESLLSNATVVVGTAQYPASPGILNDGRSIWVLIVRCAAVASLTPSVLVSPDGTTFVQAGPAITAITTPGNYRYVFAVNSTQGPIVEPYIQVQLVDGTSSATGVYVDLIGI